MSKQPESAQSIEAFKKYLRKYRQEVWQKLAQRTFSDKNGSSTLDICLEWSTTADKILTAAFEFCSSHLNFKSDLALFAYGKLGADELNLSSDVDLVLVTREHNDSLAPWLRLFRELIQDYTEDGFCFRLDFDLRPGGRMGQVISSYDEFSDYFSNYGETWERLAFVRFRSITGTESLVNDCLQIVKKFTYRKRLDFGLMEDLQDLRQKIHEQNWRRSLNGDIDLKLGLGGIRDVELFIHTQQVIHGGRNHKIQVGSTSAAINTLLDEKIFSEHDAIFLRSHYWQLRHYENLLQAKTDQQIQVLAASSNLDLISEDERNLLQKKMLECHTLVSSLLGEIDKRVQSIPETESEQKAWLKELGYSEEIVHDIWPKLREKKILSRQKEQDLRKQQRFLYLVLTKMAEHPKSMDLGAKRLHDFLHAIRAKSSFFHLLLLNTNLLERLADLFCTSSYLSSILIRKPELLDSLLFNSQAELVDSDWEESLEHCLEKKLLTQIHCGLNFLNDLKVEDSATKLTQAADEVVLFLLKKLSNEIAGDLSVLCLGKWGGKELGFQSDLDLLFLSQDPQTENPGRLARRLISRLTESQKGGALYQVDLRLRPQNRVGLLITSPNDLIDYLSKEAKIWERQAYLKARLLSPNKELSAFEKEIFASCCRNELNSSELCELINIQKQLFSKSRGALDLKYAPGGLVDIEFAVQVAILKMQTPPLDPSLFSQLQYLGQMNTEWKIIEHGYIELRKIEQLFRLLSMRSISYLNAEQSEFEELAHSYKANSAQLAHRILDLLELHQRHLLCLDPRRTSV